MLLIASTLWRALPALGIRNGVLTTEEAVSLLAASSA
jgi:hypothetical protein